MSMLSSLGRYGAAIRNAHERSKSVRMLNNLPPEIQKDIGWPVTPRSSAEDHILRITWGAAR